MSEQEKTKEKTREVTINYEGTDVKFVLVRPTVEDSRKADWEYTKTYNESLFANIYTEVQMVKLLKDRGIWTDTDNSDLAEIREEISEQVNMLLNEQDLSNRDKYALKQSISVNRMRLMLRNNALQSYLSHTCESKADEARLIFITQRCARRGDQPNVMYWKTVEDLRNENKQDLVQEVLRAVIMFLNDMPAEINDMFPESKVIIPQEFIDEIEHAGENENVTAEVDTNTETSSVVESEVAQEVIAANIEEAKALETTE